MVNKSVGLILLTEFPKLGKVALLRERGFFNLEKIGPESWTGACQVTAHGRVEENETFFDGLLRELCEELGDDFSSHLSGIISANPKKLREVSHTCEGEKEIITYCIEIDLELVKKIRLEPSSGALRPVNRDTAKKIIDLKTYNRAIGVCDRTVVAMFPDEKEAVIKALSF